MFPKRQRTLLLLMLGTLGALLLGQTLAALRPPEWETATALLYTGDSPVCVHGVVIRQEIQVTAEMAEDWVSCVSDGEKVAAGQTLLTLGTQSGDAARLVRLLRAGEEAALLTLPERRAALRAAIRTLAAADGSERQTAAESLTGILLGEGEATDAALEAAESELVAENTGSEQTVCALEAGVFAAAADGLETVLTPETPWREWSLPLAPVEETVVGRLITGDTWYFRTDLPDVPAAGQTLTARLLSGSFLTVEMTVEEVVPQAEGCRALLSCRQALSEVAALRELDVKFLSDSESGVEIPSKAVYTVKEQTGVWCLVGETVQFKIVTILQDLGDTVVVELNQSTVDTLWPGDTVLLNYR